MGAPGAHRRGRGLAVGLGAEAGTRWHGYGGAGGAFTVVDGTLRERYRDGDRPLRTHYLSPVQTSRFDDTRYHAVFNSMDQNSTSVHAYSPALLPLDDDGAP